VSAGRTAALAVLGALVLAPLSIAPAAAVAATPQTRARPPVPASLTALESGAEDIVDVALAHDRPRVMAMAAGLTSSAGGAAAKALVSAGASPAQISLLRERVAVVARISRSGPFTSVALAANAVSAVVTELYAHFSDPVPVAVRRLDYLDREAQLRSLAGQARAVTPVVARLAATWKPLRRSVVGHGGQTVAAAYARHVAAMARLSQTPGSAFRSEAVNGLNIVDELESVFAR
jgi:hypothetical protein